MFDRDNTCILTGGAEDVQACHIVPHAKEMRCVLKSFQVLMLAKYMMNVLNIRLEEIVDPPLDGISDTRNS